MVLPMPEYRLPVPEEVLAEYGGEWLVLMELAWCEYPDEPNEAFYWTRKALKLADHFWKQFAEYNLRE
ncbi:MAG: hypothetical protein KJO69_10310 [Gammaproteobacteria bacterium]|nr:hypothetical protein [Gammaproteobacteria bacterium]